MQNAKNGKECMTFFSGYSQAPGNSSKIYIYIYICKYYVMLEDMMSNYVL